MIQSLRPSTPSTYLPQLNAAPVWAGIPQSYKECRNLSAGFPQVCAHRCHTNVLSPSPPLARRLEKQPQLCSVPSTLLHEDCPPASKAGSNAPTVCDRGLPVIILTGQTNRHVLTFTASPSEPNSANSVQDWHPVIPRSPSTAHL